MSAFGEFTTNESRRILLQRCAHAGGCQFSRQSTASKWSQLTNRHASPRAEPRGPKIADFRLSVCEIDHIRADIAQPSTPRRQRMLVSFRAPASCGLAADRQTQCHAAPDYSMCDRKLPTGSGGRGASLQTPPPPGQNQAGICLSVASQSASPAVAAGSGSLVSGGAATACEASVITCGDLLAID